MFRSRPLSRNCPLAFEALEERNLLAFDSAQGYLGIKGTRGDDIIHVEITNPEPLDYEVELTLNGEHATYYFDYIGGIDRYQGVVILGLGGNDQITFANNVPIPALIDAGKGDDTIILASGTHLYPYRDYYDDVILGGAGNDTIFSGIGNDYIDGGAGDDTINSGIDNDIILGGKGNDNIHGDDGDDIVLGGKGDDTIYGEAGSDALAGDAGRDAVYGELGDDALSGGKGNDLLDGGIGSDLLTADAGHDQCYGGLGDDLFDGGAGNDFIFGEDGDDLITAGKGNDEVHGGAGKDGLFGDAGNDLLFGDENNDQLDGGNGADKCLGGDENDQLKGGIGVDQLDGQAGDNLLDPDKGADVVANGLLVDLDQEYVAVLPGIFGPSSIEIDLQNVDGQVHRIIRITASGVTNSFSPADVLIDGVKVAEVNSPFGTQVLELSSNPLLGQHSLPNDLPTIEDGTVAQMPPNQPGIFVQTFVI